MKIDRLREVIKRYPKEYAEGYNACRRAEGDATFLPYLNPYTHERRIAWTRGWGDRKLEELHKKEDTL